MPVDPTDALLAVITDAQLDGNLHHQTPTQRDRLARAKTLATQIRDNAEQRGAADELDRIAEQLRTRPGSPLIPHKVWREVADLFTRRARELRHEPTGTED
jgi:hypothetical protein